MNSDNNMKADFTIRIAQQLDVVERKTKKDSEGLLENFIPDWFGKK